MTLHTAKTPENTSKGMNNNENPGRLIHTKKLKINVSEEETKETEKLKKLN